MKNKRRQMAKGKKESKVIEETENIEDEVKEPDYIKYKFRWKSLYGLFWKSKVCIAHKFFEENNRMVLYTEEGGLFEIPNWSSNWSDLREDWAKKVQKQYKDDMVKKEGEKDESSSS